MAKTRLVNTKFWSDEYIAELEPLGKLLFIYLLTNRSTEMCGAYELSIRTMVFETGIDEGAVKNLLSRFAMDGKVEYRDGWVIVKNFLKHQQKNPNVEKGIMRAMEALPESIKALIGFDTNSHLNLNLNSNLNLTEGVVVNEAITLFKEINPSFQSLFPRKPQRAAAQRLVDLLGMDGLKNLIGYISANRGEKYFPSIATPCQLEDKYATLENFAKRQGANTALI